MVPSEGVEPPCLAALGSKPSVSANSTIGALAGEVGLEPTTYVLTAHCSEPTELLPIIIFKVLFSMTPTAH